MILLNKIINIVEKLYLNMQNVIDIELRENTTIVFFHFFSQNIYNNVPNEKFNKFKFFIKSYKQNLLRSIL